MQFNYFLADEAATLKMGAQLAPLIHPPMIIYLQGELGAGKTTLMRGLLEELGYQASVKSPSYTLVEEYNLASFNLYHFDLYRLNNTRELLNLGFDDYLHSTSVCVIEWPEILDGLVQADLKCQLKVLDSGREMILSTQNAEIESFLSKVNAS